MDAHTKVGGVWKTLAGMHTKVSGTWKEIEKGHIKVAGVWKLFYNRFTASASDSTPSGSDNGFSPTGTVVSNTTTITPVGGTAPYTYAWAQGPGGPADSGPYNATAATSATTAFSKLVADADVDRTEDWTCTVTDADLFTTTVTVQVTLTWSDLT